MLKIYPAILSGLLALQSLPAHADLRTDLDSILLPQIEHGDLNGIIIGVTVNGKRTYYRYGHVNGADSAAPDERSIFEIGSITKTFTGTLLGTLDARGVVGLNDSVAKYFPELRGKSAEKITLLDLTTHTSGLPRLPTNLAGSDDHCAGPAQFDPDNPYAQYGLTQLLCYLSFAQIGPQPAQFDLKQYSNVGVGTLGAALTQASGQSSYANLVAREITGPLGLHDTTVVLSDEQKTRFVPGFTEAFAQTDPWTFDALQGAGALRSTASDLLAYVEAEMNPPDSDLGKGMRLSQALQKSGDGTWGIGLGWLIQQNAADPLIWHDGDTGGYNASAAYRVGAKQGVVYLSDSDVPPQCLTEYFMHAPCKVNFGYALSDADFSKILGNYRSADQSVQLTIERKRAYAFAKMEGYELRMKAISPVSFDFLSVSAHIDFEVDASGAVTGLKLTQDGQQVEAKKISSNGPSPLATAQ